MRPKYMKILPETRFEKSKYLFGLDFINPKSNSVIVVEGPIDVMRMHTLGFTSTVGLMGVDLSNIQRNILLDNFEIVLIMMDNDKAGREARERITERLFGAVKLYVVRYDGHDPGELENREQIISVKPFRLKVS